MLVLFDEHQIQTVLRKKLVVAEFGIHHHFVKIIGFEEVHVDAIAKGSVKGEEGPELMLKLLQLYFLSSGLIALLLLCWLLAIAAIDLVLKHLLSQLNLLVFLILVI